MKRYLLTGVVLLLPVVLTVMVIHFLFNFFTTPFVPLVGKLLHWASARLGFAPSSGLDLFISRVLALLLLVLLIFSLGLIARRFFFRELLSLMHRILSRIPVIKTVYQVSRDVIAAFFSVDEKKAFKRAVLFPFPSPSTLALGFEAGEIATEIQNKTLVPLAAVFAPTAPHPISGFLLLVPHKELHPVDMTNEEAVKYLISCGLIHPEKRPVK